MALSDTTISVGPAAGETEPITESVHHSQGRDTAIGSLTFSVIIPEWPQQDKPFGLDWVEKLNWPQESVEVIVSRGYGPCRQRNLAAEQATGEVLVFFDNDSCPQPDYLKRLAQHFADETIAGVGGPNLALPSAKYVPNLVDAILTSRIGVLSKRARYRPVGKMRSGGDSDFIFCNFAIRRDLYLQTGGLHESLCPNEENEFFERFRQSVPGKLLVYDPELIVRRPRSATMWFFLRKMYGYGKGRSRQFKIRRSLWSLLHVLGGLALLLPVIFVLIWGGWSLLYMLAPYGAVLLMQILSCLFTQKRKSIALAIALATLATHVAYVTGLWKGLFESRKRQSKSAQVVIERLDISD